MSQAGQDVAGKADAFGGPLREGLHDGPGDGLGDALGGGAPAAAAQPQMQPDLPALRRPVACPVEDWLAFLGHRWNALILWHLRGAGPLRHGELADCLPGIAPKVLSVRLDGLEGRGLVVRSQLQTFPRGVAYGISDSGLELLQVLDQIDLWSKRHAPQPVWSAWPGWPLAAGQASGRPG